MNHALCAAMRTLLKVMMTGEEFLLTFLKVKFNLIFGLHLHVSALISQPFFFVLFKNTPWNE